MGFFGGKKVTTKEHATTTPIIPDYAQGGIANYYAAHSNLFGGGGGGGGGPMSGGGTPPSTSYANVFPGSGGTATATYAPGPNGTYVQTPASAGAPVPYSPGTSSVNDFIVQPNRQQQAAFDAQFTGSNPTLLDAIQRTGNIGPSQFAGAPITTAGPAQQAQTQQANALYADTVQARTRDARIAKATAPDRGILAAAQLGDPTKVDLSALNKYAAAQAAAGSQAAGAGAAAGLASDFIDKYQPYADKALVDATMAEYNDQAGRQKAAYAAQAAGRGAFGGSGHAIGEANLLSDITRKGALTMAEMQDLAFTRALQAAQGDASNTTGANIASANNMTQASVANANNSNAMNMFNAGQINDMTGLRMQGDIQGALANAGYANQYGLERFRSDNSNNQLVYGTEADLGKFNAGQANDVGMFNAGQFNDTSRFNAGQMNSANQWNAGNQTQNNQFNANQWNDTSQFNTGQTNAQNQFNTSALNQGNQFNSSQFNDWSMGNQRLGLDAANQLGQLGVAQSSNARADATTNAQLGGLLEEIQRRNQLAPYTQLGMQGELLNPALLNIIAGSDINSTGTSKESGGGFWNLLSSASQAASAAAMASDIRVKRDIVKLGEEPDGLGVFRYNYIWDDADEMPRFGVMAQEVERLRPWALGPVINGIKTVNYHELGAR